MSDPAKRREQALALRIQAAHIAHDRPHPEHIPNGDEDLYVDPDGNPTHLASFTKGLPHHRRTGLIHSPRHFALFVTAVSEGTYDAIRAVPLAPQSGPRNERFRSSMAAKSDAFRFADARAWEAMAAGLAFDLQGPDSHAVTLPPAPKLDSPELVAEVTELYWMALLRDVPFVDFLDHPLVGAAVNSLNATAWSAQYEDPCAVPEEERKRLRAPFDTHSVFRGNTPGELRGPYLSQFLLAGSAGLGAVYETQDGYVQYGATRIDHRVRVALPAVDYMTTWEAWLDVQNGADCRGRESYEDGDRFRFITTPRDLATFVHYDALYQAYLNACIIMLEKKFPYDKGIPFQRDDDIDKQQGFALFGGPHILTLVTEVATRALKAIRYQKYNVHRRLRPEAIGGLIERYHNDNEDPLFAPVQPLYDGLNKDLLDLVAQHNATQNERSDHGNPRSEDFSPSENKMETRLLPMAFAEGSPMHPSYGAGHAAVAGACTTILKAFFDHTHELGFAYVPGEGGESLTDVVEELDDKLTVETELNKLCSNISIGRNWAGVHYFTDYRESIVLGEKVALGMLEEQKITYREKFSMTIPLFDGTSVTI